MQQETMTTAQQQKTIGMETVEITAPSDLPGGYKLIARSENNTAADDCFSVTVPMDGVQKGQVFQTTKRQTQQQQERWKAGIFGCFQFGLFHADLWNAFCCPHILMNPVSTRMELTKSTTT
jgi:hypothetical protein